MAMPVRLNFHKNAEAMNRQLVPPIVVPLRAATTVVVDPVVTARTTKHVSLANVFRHAQQIALENCVATTVVADPVASAFKAKNALMASVQSQTANPNAPTRSVAMMVAVAPAANATMQKNATNPVNAFQTTHVFPTAQTRNAVIMDAAIAVAPAANRKSVTLVLAYPTPMTNAPIYPPQASVKGTF